ncbi:hypothetical protein BpHYR1_013597 [Brachionus plicatilis]|uniref:Uncharacterized protein n=1 Tax=Brachionus plicatilis TaxID=10195 RepID=A0A3M7R0C7_BRAPC|nr:hypothetical protein BpHYR1_013597 [Brachionus plicatilis]
MELAKELARDFPKINSLAFSLFKEKTDTRKNFKKLIMSWNRLKVKVSKTFDLWSLIVVLILIVSNFGKAAVVDVALVVAFISSSSEKLKLIGSIDVVAGVVDIETIFLFGNSLPRDFLEEKILSTGSLSSNDRKSELVSVCKN